MSVPYTNLEGLRDYHARVTSPVHARWLWIVGLAFLLGLLLGAQLHAADCVRLQVRPSFLLSRGDVDVQAHVARHADHRALVVIWNSETGGAGSRSFELEGTDRDGVLFQWTNRDQVAGHYVYDARVTDAGGRALGSSRAEIRSLEPVDEHDDQAREARTGNPSPSSPPRTSAVVVSASGVSR